MGVEIICGEAREVLATLPAASVHACICSPPYYQLRNYSGGPLEIGTESTPQEFVAALVDVFRGVKRVLRDDGTLWVVLGDSYAASSGTVGRNDQDRNRRNRWVQPDPLKRAQFNDTGAPRGERRPRCPAGIPPKSLLGIPWRLAFALQDEGWVLRQEIIWSKTAPMPECLDPQTTVYTTCDSGIRRLTLDQLHAEGAPYPLILTPAGWQPIQNVWETIKDGAIAFDAGKVSSVVCSPEHLWPVSHARRRTVIHDVPAERLVDGGYRNYLLHVCLDHGLPGEDSPAPIVEGQGLDYDMGWLLGLYAAEGGFARPQHHLCKFTLGAAERPMAQRIVDLARARFGAQATLATAPGYLDVTFSNASWHRLAVSLVPGKCTTKDLAIDTVLNAPRAFRRGIWDGYLAGDGSRRPAGVAATSASQALRDAMCVVASSIGLITSKGTNVQKDPRTGKTYVSYGLWTPYMRRGFKTGSSARQLTIRNKRRITGPQRMIDVQVEGGLFLIDDGLVTHNSVQDRCTRSHETVFMLSQQPQYFYDAMAIAEPCTGHPQGTRGVGAWNKLPAETTNGRGASTLHTGQPTTRNARSVWTINPQPFSARAYGVRDIEHYAVFPEELAQRCILAGTSEAGCCPNPRCLAPYRRVVERMGGNWEDRKKTGAPMRYGIESSKGTPLNRMGESSTTTTGWEAGCSCQAGPPIPCTTLDIFLGSGTVALVSKRLGRSCVGIELNPAYAEMARRRVESVPHTLFSAAVLADDGAAAR